MKQRLVACAFLAMLSLTEPASAPIFAGTFIWSGVSSTGWQGNITPPYDGSDDLIFGKALNQTVTLNGDRFINSITQTSGDGYVVNSVGNNPLLLTFNTGIFSVGASNGNTGLYFDQAISIQGYSSALTMDAGNNGIVVAGKITGSSDLYLVNSSVGATGAFIFNNISTGNDYDSSTYIQGVAGTPVTVAFWNSMPFGYGPVYVDNAATLIAHGSQYIGNDFIFNTTVANDVISLKSWDAPLYFDGYVTLANDTTLSAQLSQANFPANLNTGVYPLPGPQRRNPIVFDGNIDESGGARTLSIRGPGVIVLDSYNTYSGGTIVGPGGASGSLVFGSNNSVPASGTITVNPAGYVGFADPTAGEFATFLTHVDTAGSTGAIGLDTLPGNSTAIFSDDIDLTGDNSNLRLGSATSAILTGIITPQGTDYLFGNGGGTLYVQSNFSDLGGSNVILNNNNVTAPLTLYLQNSPNYLGNTIANNGFIVFDGFFLPGPGKMVAAGDSVNIGASYIGMTNNVDATPTDLLNSFDLTNTWGIIGFDTHAGNSTFNVTDNLDLSGFNNGVYLGTSTSAILSGNLTPTPDNILRLTAAQGGTLEVDSPLSGPMALSIGTPAPSGVYSSGTVYLPNANTYSGGTTFNSTVGGITLEVGDNNALGTGALTLPQNVIAGLQASFSGINLPNNIVFQVPGGANAPASLFISGNSDLELSGPISGPGSINFVNPSVDFSPNLTLSGNNGGFSGDISLFNSVLTLANDNAAGTGTIHFLDSNSTLILNTPSPVLYGLKGQNGFVEMYSGNALTIDMSNPAHGHEYGGTFDDGGSNASITVTSTTGGDAFYLYGASYYAGGTFVGTSGADRAAVALGNDQALGSGPVTLNTSLQGALAVNVGVTFSNNLNFIGGTLQGFGTFAPAIVNGTPGGPIIFGAGQAAVPGVYGLGTHSSPGNLTFGTNVEFANGGKLLWSLQDVTRADGYSFITLNGSGNLTITAGVGGFTIYLATLDATGAVGPANLVGGTAYTFAIATTTSGTITGFDPTYFTVDSSLFQNGAVSNAFLTADANNLYINFTAVPEPSTYALLGLGFGALLIPALRRRRQV